MHHLPLLAAIAALAWSGQEPEVARDVVRLAQRAIAGDSVAPVRARWTARVARDPGDRLAALGLAMLQRLELDFQGSDSALARLLPAPGARPDAVAVQARTWLAYSLLQRGRFVEADTALERVTAEATALGDRSTAAEAIFRRAVARSRTGEVGSSLELVRRGLALVSPGDDATRALGLCTSAGIRATAGDALARRDAEAGLEHARAAGHPQHEAVCVAHIAQDHLRKGEPDSAIARFTAAEALQRGVRDWTGLAATLQWRGYVRRMVGEYGLARRDLDSALVLAHRVDNDQVAGWTLINLAAIAGAVGDRVGAAALLHTARTALERAGDRWGAASARWQEADQAPNAASSRAILLEVRSALEAQGTLFPLPALDTDLLQYSRAQADWAAVEQQLAELRARAARDPRGWAGTDLDYEAGALALGQADLERARRAFELVLDRLGPEQRMGRYTVQARLAEVAARAGRLAEAERRMRRAADSLDAWRATLDDRALRLAVFGLAYDRADPDLGIATTLALLASGGRAEAAFALAEQRRARELLDRIVRREAMALDTSPAPPHAVQWATNAISLSALRSSLPEGTAMVSYLTGAGDEPTTAFIITSTGLAARTLTPADSLRPLISRFRAAIESGEHPRGLAGRLGTALLDPVAETVGSDVTRLVIIPDGPLHGVPFDALRLASGAFAVERFEIGYAPSATVMARLWGRPPRRTPGRLVALGDPSVSEAAVTMAGAPLGALPEAAKEARAVARFARDAWTLIGPEANELALRREADSTVQVLHLAVHALVDESSVARTALVLAPHEGDGLVRPDELAALHLDADLVVLSACRSAIGVVLTGEGVQGLAAPLFEAGARAVAATLWAVDDRPTRELVVAFYRSMARGEPAGQALRTVKLAALQRGAPASTWAAFSLWGDARVRPALREPERPRWVWLAIVDVALIAGLGAVILARKQRRRSANRRPSA